MGGGGGCGKVRIGGADDLWATRGSSSTRVGGTGDVILWVGFDRIAAGIDGRLGGEVKVGRVEVTVGVLVGVGVTGVGVIGDEPVGCGRVEGVGVLVTESDGGRVETEIADVGRVVGVGRAGNGGDRKLESAQVVVGLGNWDSLPKRGAAHRRVRPAC